MAKEEGPASGPGCRVGGAGSPQQRPLRGRGREKRATPRDVRALRRHGPGRPRDGPNRTAPGPAGHPGATQKRGAGPCEGRGAPAWPLPARPASRLGSGGTASGWAPTWAGRAYSLPPVLRGTGAQRGRGARPIRSGEEAPGREPQLPSPPRWRNRGSQGDAGSPPRSPNGWAGLNRHPPPEGTKDPDTA